MSTYAQLYSNKLMVREDAKATLGLISQEQADINSGWEMMAPIDDNDDNCCFQCGCAFLVCACDPSEHTDACECMQCMHGPYISAHADANEFIDYSEY